MIDPETLDAMIKLLPPGYASLLSRELEPAWKVRARVLEARDDAIRGALSLLEGSPNPSGRLAEQIALQSQEKRAGRLTGDYRLVDAVEAILQHNGGATMTARHIRRIGAGQRTPWT